MKYINIFVLIILFWLTSCTYDYNYPDMWVQPKLTLVSNINTISIVEQRGYTIAAVDTYIELFDENDQSLNTIHYTSSLDTFSPSREASYFVVTTLCYGWPKGTYNTKEEVCELTSKRFYIEELDDSVVEMTMEHIESIEYKSVAKYQLYLSCNLPLDQWAKDYGYSLFSADYYYVILDENDSPAFDVSYWSKASSLDPISCSAGDYIQYAIVGNYESKKKLFTAIFDKIPVSEIAASGQSKDNPYKFTTDNSYTLTYHVDYQYTFEISWSSEFVGSIISSYGYHTSKLVAYVDFIDNTNNITETKEYTTYVGTISTTSPYVQLRLECYGYPTDGLPYNTSHVCTITFDKVKTADLANEGRHTFGCNDSYSVDT